MKSFTIFQAINFIDNSTPFNSFAVRSISYLGLSECEFKVTFNDQTAYCINMDDDTYYKLEEFRG